MSAERSDGGAVVGGEGGGRRARAIDPDVDLHLPADRVEIVGDRAWSLLGVIAVGGALGACARHGAQRLWPGVDHTAFPLGMFLINVLGCALIGVLMTVVSECRTPSPALLRPFLGVGVLGGFTSFSAYALDGYLLLDRGAVGTAVLYLVGTLLVALAAVWTATLMTRVCLRRGGGWRAGAGGRPS